MLGSQEKVIAEPEGRPAEPEPLVERLTRENEALRAENSVLRKQNETLRKENESLKAEKRKGHRQAGRFSRDKKKPDPKKPDPKKPGRKPGHEPASRPAPEPDHVDETVAVALCGCPFCGGGLQDLRTEELYQTDIPRPSEPIVTKFDVESGFCPSCKKRVKARDPRQRADPNSVVRSVLGPNVLALLALLKDGHGMPFRRIADFLRYFWQIEVTPGGISLALDRVADRLRGTYEVIVTELRSSTIAHVDETGWRINGDTAWLWVFTNSKLTLYTIRRSRGSDVLEAVLGERFEGILASDCLNSYESYDAEWKAKCLGHLIRDLRELQEEKTGIAARFASRGLDICRDAIVLKSTKPTLPPEVYDAAILDLVDRVMELIQGRYSDPDNVRLANRIEKHMTGFFLFLEVDGLDATNNRAERQLRPAVVTRKISCGSRTDNGAERHSIIPATTTTTGLGLGLGLGRKRAFGPLNGYPRREAQDGRRDAPWAKILGAMRRAAGPWRSLRR